MRRTIPLNDVSGVSTGSKATVRLVDTLAYHGILIQATNIALAELQQLRVFANDKEIMAFTGPDLDAMAAYFQYAPYGATKQLFIPFTGPGMLDQAQEEGTAIQLGVPYKDGTLIRQMRIEIDIASGIVGAVGLKAWGIVRDAVANREPWLPFVRQTTIDVQSTGEKSISDLVDTRSAREAFATQVFFKTADISRLLVQRNGVDMFDRAKDQNERIQLNGVRTPQAGWVVFDTRENGYGDVADALSAGDANTLVWKPTFGSTGTIRAYVWTIGRLQ
jgi:hypothetical protein